MTADQTSPAAAQPPTDQLLEKLARIRLEFNASADLTGYYESEPGILNWHAEASLTLFDEEADDEAWGSSALSLRPGTPSEDGSRDLTLATFRGRVIHLPLQHVDSLDDEADYAHFILAFGRDGELNLDLDNELEGWGGRVVILERAELAPGWRHLGRRDTAPGTGGLGALLTGRVLRWMTAEAKVVLLHPFPVQFSGRGDDPGFAAACQAVQRVWAGLGFAHWRDDIWYLDPACVAWVDALDELEQHFGLSDDGA